MRNLQTGNRQAALLALLIVVLAAVLTGPARAQTAITFTDNYTENAFPEGLSFFITAASSEGDIRSATLFYRFGDSTNWARQNVEVGQGNEVSLLYELDTADTTIVPSSPIYYYWEVSDTAGNRQQSEETLVTYDDIRFDWQILENENIAVLWHDRSEDFGQRVFDIAQRAFTEQQALFGVAPERQIQILIYNDFDEFAEWHSFLSEFVGGQAFPSLGITAQIVNAYDSEAYWLNDVIPHEISHLYFYQASYHPINNVPAWLNEGMAQYNEFGLTGYDLLYSTQETILDGGLIPLWSLSGSFGYDEEKFRFAYDEAYSAVTFMVDAYGEEGVIELLAAFREGLSEDDAFRQAFGRTLDEFELDWLAWQDVPLELYPTRTPRPELVWPTSPPMAVTPSRIPTETPEPATTPSTTPTEPAVVADAATEESPAEPAATPQPTATAVVDDAEADSGGLPCISGLLPLALLAMVMSNSTGRRTGASTRLRASIYHIARRRDVDSGE